MSRNCANKNENSFSFGVVVFLLLLLLLLLMMMTMACVCMCMSVSVCENVSFFFNCFPCFVLFMNKMFIKLELSVSAWNSAYFCSFVQHLIISYFYLCQKSYLLLMLLLNDSMRVRLWWNWNFSIYSRSERTYVEYTVGMCLLNITNILALSSSDFNSYSFSRARCYRCVVVWCVNVWMFGCMQYHAYIYIYLCYLYDVWIVPRNCFAKHTTAAR